MKEIFGQRFAYCEGEFFGQKICYLERESDLFSVSEEPGAREQIRKKEGEQTINEERDKKINEINKVLASNLHRPFLLNLMI